MQDSLVSLEDAEALVGEIDRLRAEVAQLEARVGLLDDLAHRDALVGLPNRRSFLASLERLIGRVERYGDTGAMLFIDVDGLKMINDRFGHTAGDKALMEISRILVSAVRKSDCIARIGGDEFAVLLERADEQSAWHMALRIVETVTASDFSINGERVTLSVAVGVAAVQPGDDSQSVIDRADREMYRVKTA